MIDGATWDELVAVALAECESPKPQACRTCPFRIENFARHDGSASDAFYTDERRSELWSGDPAGLTAAERTGLRDGVLFICHHTGTPLLGGTNPNAVAPRPCAGALAVQQRELLRDHARGNRVGSELSREGTERIAGWMLAAGRISINRLRRLDRGVLLERAHPAIADTAIGHDRLDPPSAAEQRAWQPSR